MVGNRDRKAGEKACRRRSDPLPGVNPQDPRPAGSSYPSRAPETDANLLALQHDRDLAVAVGKAQHLLQGLGVFFDIPINDRQPLFGFGLPGPLGKRSALLAEGGDLPGH